MDNKSNKSYKNKVQPRVFINDEDLKVSRKINILDWLILIVVFLIIFVVYTPLSIWSEEEFYRIESRNNMLVVNDAQKFYYELTGRYTIDTTILFQFGPTDLASSSQTVDCPSLLLLHQYVVHRRVRSQVQL